MNPIFSAITLFMVSSVMYGASKELIQLRDRTRLIVNTMRCAHCHTPGLSTTKSAALKVYDLTAPLWSARMNDRQLQDFQRRLKEKLTTAELIALGGGAINEKQLSRTQIGTIDLFISKELENRRKEPLERFRDLQAERNPEFFKALGL